MKQRGFTLVEILLAVAIGGIIMAGAATAVYHTIVGTDRTSSQVTVLADVNQAALAVKKDLQMAHTTDLSGTPQNSAQLNWTDYTGFESGNQTHSISYVLSDANLLRTYDGTESIVGRNITSVSFAQNDRVIDVVITSSTSGSSPKSETLEFSVFLRTEEVQ